MTKEEILRHLTEFKKKDIPWRDGKLWSYVYYLNEEVESIGKMAYMEFLTENGIDPTAFGSLKRMENEVLGLCKQLLRGDQAVGSLTTGGTESILLAVKTARDRAAALNPEQKEFEMVLPETIHAAFYKAAHYFKVKPVTVPVDAESLAARPDLIEPYINKHTILITASAVSYAYGIMDDVPGIAKLAEANGIPFHVDGCIGGFILSTARTAGMEVENFDFSLPGVTSISMDLHKYGYCPKGASVLLHKNEEYRQHQFFVCNEWTGYTFANTGILSSKSGGPIAAAWAVTNYVGIKGYEEIAKKTLDVAQKIKSRLEEHPNIEILASPRYSLISFTVPGLNVYALHDELKRRNWYPGLQLPFNDIPVNIHLTVAAQHWNTYDEFLKVLFESIEKVKKEGPEELKFDFESLTAEEISGMLNQFGIGDGELPEELATINQVMAQLPSAVTKELLIKFLQGLYTP